jgi:hypothetical protein
MDLKPVHFISNTSKDNLISLVLVPNHQAKKVAGLDRVDIRLNMSF